MLRVLAMNTQTITSPWAPLRNRTFLFIWVATIASNIGTWMHEVGASWLMMTLTSDPLMVVLVQSATALPIFLFALPAGALSDILDRRRYLLFVQVLMLLFALALALITIMGAVTPWILLVLTFALACGTAFSAPAWQAITPELVPNEQLTSAVSLNSAGINIARAIGPALGGFLVALYSPVITFFLNALSFLGILIILYWWKRQPDTESSRPKEYFFQAIKTGVRYVCASSPLRAIMVKAIAFFLSASAVWALLPLISKQELGLEADGFGMLVGCIGLGAIFGAYLLPKWRARLSTDHLVLAASINFAVMTFLLSQISNFYLALIIMVFIGIGWITVVSSLNAAVQHVVPNWVRSRALASYLVVFFGCIALGSMVWGGLAKSVSIETALVVASLLQVIGVLVMGLIKLPKFDFTCLESSEHWPAPITNVDVDQDQGPVLITIEYHVEKANQSKFKTIAKQLSSIRKRDGAYRWALFFDTKKPELIVETFTVPSWLEHLRQHERITKQDKSVQDRLRALCKNGLKPEVRHLVAM